MPPASSNTGSFLVPESIQQQCWTTTGLLGFELDSRRLSTIDESRTTSGGKDREAAASVPPSSSAQRFSTRTTRLNLFVIAMAIAKAVAHAPIVKPEPPQHKRGRSLMFLAHHGGVDLTQAPTASRQSKHKHHKHKHNEHHHKHQKSATPVYDQCFHEAMKLKTRILIEHRERPTRFSLSVMKRVVIPPVNIPKKLAGRRGSSDLVSGKRVPFTKAMWETKKRIYSKTHNLPVIRESF